MKRVFLLSVLPFFFTACATGGNSFRTPASQPAESARQLEISASRQVSPMLETECKEQRGVARTAVEKELEKETHEAEQDFQNKCRASEFGQLCFGFSVSFDFKGDGQDKSTGTCTTTVLVVSQ